MSDSASEPPSAPRPAAARPLDADQGGRERREALPDPLLALHERVHLLLQVFNGTREGVLITDAHSRVLDVNEAFVQITGYSRDDVLGRTPRLLSSGRHDPTFYEQMWSTLQQTGRWQGEIWNRRASGEVYAEWLRILRVADDGARRRTTSGSSATSPRKSATRNCWTGWRITTR